MSAVPLEFLRGLMGFIACACAYMLGRTIAMVRQGWAKPSRVTGWAIRLILCLGAVAFRHPLDVVDTVVWALAGVAFSFAMIGISRGKKQEEDLTDQIFPHEP